MFKFFGKLLDFNEKEIKKMAPMVEKINSLEPEIKKLKDDEFPAKTASFKERLATGETIDDLLPEAFALAREAIWRVVGERAFDVQLMAAIALHQGKIAEQKTGEGKTLSAVITAYLNGLAGNGVHIVTVNDYLARRDTGWYGKALSFAGLSLGCIIHEQAFLLDLEYTEKSQDDERLRHLRPVERKEAYLADMTYGTNNEFGFDYLRDNMVGRLEDMVQRGHHFAIVDEVDSILIDEARTPLIISAPDTEPTKKYYDFANLIKALSSDTDYLIDEKLKTANLTDHGIRKVEKWLGVENLYEKDFDTLHHIENALKARTLFLRDRDYIVKDNQVIIVDEFTGRLMFGRRWSDGLHQAVEAKEGVTIQQESITLATISFQNYFRMYQKLAGMTGTAATESEEFNKIYGLEVMMVPTNLPMIRLDNPDVVYKTTRAKYAAVVREIEECFKKGQPVLLGTTSIEKNEIIAKFLEKKGVPHNVLNAKQHEKEARIIAEAGREKAVTVATNMAGRGVDIVLGGSKEGRELKEWEEENDVIKVGEDKINFSATLDDKDYSDGFSFTVQDHTYLEFDLKMNDGYDLSRINIGGFLENPENNIFRIEKDYFSQLKMKHWYQRRPFSEFFSKLFSNKYFTFTYIFILGIIVIEILRVTVLTRRRRKIVWLAISYTTLILVEICIYFILKFLVR